MTPTILWIIKYRYAVLLPLALFQGSLFALLIGFLIRLGYLGFLPAYGILIIGDIIPDSGWYFLGKLGNRNKIVEKYGARFKIISGSFAVVEKLWRDHPNKTMFFGKLAAGVSTPILISAGMVRMTYRAFIARSLACAVTLYAIFLTLGYYLGSSYAIAQRDIRDGTIFIAIIIAAIFAVYVLLSAYAKKELALLDREETKD